MIDAKRDPIPVIKWPHTLTENTFSDEYIKIINEAFADWEKIKNPWEDPRVTSYSSIYWQPDCSRWKEEVEDLFNRSKNSPDWNKSAKDYTVVLELSVMGPNKDYHYHCDVTRKQATGVCYWNQGKDGTRIKSGGTEVDIQYKFNRAFWFCNVTGDMWDKDRKVMKNPDIPWHTYFNHTDGPRYTVNINYTPQSRIHGFINQKWAQFEGFYKNNMKPVWRPLISGQPNMKRK